ncbi:MAG: hypothetical protein KA974_11325 [Saprospiraceae bacterium]|nr:hypothetical protein [Saprospiraceae bacterium]MBP7680221.1 hypothetical protein [Saprospiraceae bacterium]
MKNLFRPIISQIPSPIRNRYALTGIVFFLWMAFFDRHSIWTQLKLKHTLNKLHEDRALYEQRIAETEQERLAIEADKEKFAREQYYMHKENEDVFIIVEEE